MTAEGYDKSELAKREEKKKKSGAQRTIQKIDEIRFTTLEFFREFVDSR